jgi:primosomal protein N' (replication factor Y) (superfamily II helicase)
MENPVTYIEVAVPLPVFNTYTYAVPESMRALIAPGLQVLVPFGRRKLIGYILGPGSADGIPKIREIIDVLDESAVFPAAMLPFFQWMAAYYLHPIGEVICEALPGGISKKKKAVTGPKTERYAAPIPDAVVAAPLTEARQAVMDALTSGGGMAVRELAKIVPSAHRQVQALADKGLVVVSDRPVYRDPFGDPVPPDVPHKLNPEQYRAVSTVVGAMGAGFAVFLLAGVTGSGKTEVYMQAAAEAVRRDTAVLVLVPEIALVSETERRFRARFGDDVAVLHSGLSAGERYDQWVRIRCGQSRVVIGARSAIFAPLTDIGLIIVDEEHDTSYKQESRFRYNARDMAVVRARQAGAVVLLGSATPSVQSVYNVLSGKFCELNLKRRIHRQAMPEIHIEDLRKQKESRGIWRFITPALHLAMKETLERGEQVLLFLNRRGYATWPVCAGCGQAVKCRHCDVTLILHQGAGVYKCHQCGYAIKSNVACATCGSNAIKRLGMGTEKIEHAVKALFPEARVARMDRDTVARKGALLEILKGLRHREIDVLIGTQMVAKGHDFPGITLVGIICADLSLSFPDFRAGELTFQVLAQVAGRAGRGDRPGRVVLQTYNPEHFTIAAARDQDFMTFYRQEIGFRQTFQYPPFARMIQLKISGRDPEKTREFAENVGALCRKLQGRATGPHGTGPLGNKTALAGSDLSEQVEILGPIEAPLSRIAGQYRWQILLKSTRSDQLHRLARQLIFDNGAAISSRHVSLAVDVDPFFMM